MQVSGTVAPQELCHCQHTFSAHRITHTEFPILEPRGACLSTNCFAYVPVVRLPAILSNDNLTSESPEPSSHKPTTTLSMWKVVFGSRNTDVCALLI